MKKPKKFVIYSGILLVLGLAIFLVIALVNGWDILGFFSTSNAIAMYIIIAIWLVICGRVFIKERIDRL